MHNENDKTIHYCCGPEVTMYCSWLYPEQASLDLGIKVCPSSHLPCSPPTRLYRQNYCGDPSINRNEARPRNTKGHDNGCVATQYTIAQSMDGDWDEVCLTLYLRRVVPPTKPSPSRPLLASGPRALAPRSERGTAQDQAA